MTNPPADTAPGAVEPCPVCKQPLTNAPGIGLYCATEDCPVLDDDLLWDEDGTRKPGVIRSIRSQGEIAEGLPVELRAYAKHLRTWTCDVEEFGAVRPLKDAIAEAATLIEQQAATIAERDERIERLLRQQGLEDPDADVRRTTLNRSKGS